MNTKVYLTLAAAKLRRQIIIIISAFIDLAQKQSNPNPSNFPTIIGIFKQIFKITDFTFHPKYSFLTYFIAEVA